MRGEPGCRATREPWIEIPRGAMAAISDSGTGSKSGVNTPSRATRAPAIHRPLRFLGQLNGGRSDERGTRRRRGTESDELTAFHATPGLTESPS